MARTFKLGSIVVKVTKSAITVTTDKAAKAASRANARKNARLARARRSLRLARVTEEEQALTIDSLRERLSEGLRVVAEGRAEETLHRATDDNGW
jgi:hypothetical protein